jgi:hypothetical protein
MLKLMFDGLWVLGVGFFVDDWVYVVLVLFVLLVLMRVEGVVEG